MMKRNWNKEKSSKTVLAVRAMVGAYLLYIDYQIYADVMAREGTSKYVMMGFMALFAIVGITLVTLTVLSFLGLRGGSAETDVLQDDTALPDGRTEEGDSAPVEKDGDEDPMA